VNEETAEEGLYDEIEEVPATLKQEGNEGLFVKSIELVQGDERDAIFLSVGFGPTETGRPSNHFGPLNKDGGERRLNVAVTRARVAMVVVSSLKSSDITSEKRGPQLLKEYLLFAESGGSSLPPQPHDQADFERAVEEAVRGVGFGTRRHVGRFDYVVDIGVVDPENPDRLLLGIVCDGRMYRDAATVRERERLRHEILGNLGWRVHRVWSCDWVRNRESEVGKIIEAIENAKEPLLADAPAPMRPETPAAGAPDGNLPTDSADFSPEQEPADDGTATAQGSTLPPGLTYYDSRLDDLRRYLRPNMSMRDFAEVLLQIVSREAPIHTEIAVRRTRDLFQFGRAGSRIRSWADDALEMLSSANQVEIRSEFIYVPGLPIVGRAHRRGTAQRNIDHVCLEEIAEIAIALLRVAYGMRHDELTSETARILGFAATSANIRERIGEAIALLEVDSRIQVNGSQIRPLDPP
jgi:hypothetical protein